LRHRQANQLSKEVRAARSDSPQGVRIANPKFKKILRRRHDRVRQNIAWEALNVEAVSESTKERIAFEEIQVDGKM
jgi:hypothetical protein